MPKRFFLLLALPFAFSCKSPPEQRHSTEEQPMTSQKSDPKGRGDSEGKGAPSSDLTAPSQNLVSESDKNSAMNLYDFSLKDIHGSALPLKNYAGQVVLIVNVASECGFTNQYAGLQKLYEEQKDAGLVILGLPCNDFGGQEPEAEAEIASFCEKNFHVSFPLSSKIVIKGENPEPLYAWLTKNHGPVTWNFSKFLISRKGEILRHFASDTEPDSPELTQAIDEALKQPR